MILTYQAVDKQGRRTNDAIEASNSKEAVAMLRRRGLFVTTIQKNIKDRVLVEDTYADSTGVALPVKILSMLTRQLAMLLHAGSGLVPALSAIKRQMQRRDHVRLLNRIIADLEEGATVTEAFRKHPKTFDSIYCAILAAGEASGTLGEMFDRLSGIVGKRRLMRKKILGALAYPALLIWMCSSIINVLLFFVLPRFAEMFHQLRVDPPATTKWLLACGVLLRTHWYLILAGVGAVGVLIALVLKSSRGRQWLANVQLYVPLLGPLRCRLIQGQVFRTMGMLLESRVDLLDVLELVRGATKNHRFLAMFDAAEESVTAGGSLTSAFEGSGLIEPYICQAIRTGEESGGLAGGLSYCADILDESNEEMVGVVTRLIEPAILIGMGGVVGGVAISLFLPLFDLTSAMK